MKAICPECGREIGLTAAGRFRNHNNHPLEGRLCEGTGLYQKPQPLSEVLQDMAEGYAPSLAPEVTVQPALGSPPPAREALVAPGAVVSFQVGDRVTRKPDGPHGVVQGLRADEVFVHWGTTMIRNSEGQPVENRAEDWVPKTDLKLAEQPVYYGSTKEKNRELLWEPSLRGKI